MPTKARTSAQNIKTLDALTKPHAKPTKPTTAKPRKRKSRAVTPPYEQQLITALRTKLPVEERANLWAALARSSTPSVANQALAALAKLDSAAVVANPVPMFALPKDVEIAFGRRRARRPA